MRIKAIVLLSLILSGCASSSPFHVACSGPYEPDLQLVAKRVLAAHGDLSAASVLECASSEGVSGWSDDPDEEACSVVFDAQANEVGLTVFYSWRPLDALPAVVAGLAGDVAPIRVRGRGTWPSKQEPLLFEMSDPTVAILYAVHRRCFVLEEVL